MVINVVGGIGKVRAAGGVLVGALAAGAVAMGPAPVAGATCISAFGLGNSADCRSTIGSVAIAVGTGAQAAADGLLGVAFALGTDAVAVNSLNGVGNVAVAIGDNSLVNAQGYVSFAIGTGGATVAGQDGSFGNLAITVGGSAPQQTLTAGVGNLAVTLFGTGACSAIGILNNAFNVGSTGFNNVAARGNLSGATNLFGTSDVQTNGASLLSSAFNVGGSGNTVAAGPGPLAIAGSVLLTGQTISKVGPGININGLVIGGAASEKAPAATARQTKRTGPATATRSTRN